MQSEKPNVAKKAEENKIFAKPVPKDGVAMAVTRKEDERVAARLGSEPQEGVGSGAYSEFLHQWAMNVSRIYNPSGVEPGCTPTFDVDYMNGHVYGVEPVDACGDASEQAFRVAIETAPRPPMPTSFGGRHIDIRFYDTGRGR